MFATGSGDSVGTTVAAAVGEGIAEATGVSARGTTTATGVAVGTTVTAGAGDCTAVGATGTAVGVETTIAGVMVGVSAVVAGDAIGTGTGTRAARAKEGNAFRVFNSSCASAEAGVFG